MSGGVPIPPPRQKKDSLEPPSASLAHDTSWGIEGYEDLDALVEKYNCAPNAGFQSERDLDAALAEEEAILQQSGLLEPPEDQDKCLQEEKEKRATTAAAVVRQLSVTSLKTDRMAECMHEIIKLNVGGTGMMTLRGTLLSKGTNFFTGLLNGEVPATVDEDGAYFIDKDPECFRIVLNYMRTGKWNVPKNVSFQSVSDLAAFLALDPPPAHLMHSDQNSRNQFLFILNATGYQKALRFNGGVFPNLNLFRVPFLGVDFQHATLRYSTFQTCSFKRCIFQGADLTGAKFSDCVFENTKVLEGDVNCSTVLTDCKVRCRCFCGGKGSCAFSFSSLRFQNCDFFQGEEFESHPMEFANCTFENCRINITLYNVSEPSISIKSCKFDVCEFHITYASPSQIGCLSPPDFVKKCSTGCVSKGTTVTEVFESQLSETLTEDTRRGNRHQTYSLELP